MVDNRVLLIVFYDSELGLVRAYPDRIRALTALAEDVKGSGNNYDKTMTDDEVIEESSDYVHWCIIPVVEVETAIRQNL